MNVDVPPSEFYPGNYVRVFGVLKFYKIKNINGIGLKLDRLQFLRDGTAEVQAPRIERNLDFDGNFF